MNALPIEIRYSRAALWPVAAWLLAGDDPSAWLRTLAECRVSQLAMRLRIIPVSMHDRRPLGCLVTLGARAGESNDGVRSGAPHGAAPYGVAAERLYLPIDARFDPAVSEAELAAMLSPDFDYVWHPRAGLVAFEAHEVLCVSDLLALGSRRPTLWNGATPGVMLAPRLLSLEPDEPPSIDDVLTDARGDIGSRSDESDALPRSDAERTPGIMSSLNNLGLQSLAHTVKFFAAMAPGGAASPTWINHLDDWAKQTLGGITAASLADRFKELHRLMAMLEQNPDEGLKFALPLGGEAHRGAASPSNRLGRRDVDFRLGSLGGGRPADVWDVPSDLQMRLTARYRELAMREMRLGRQRRAAYIYAQLLHDLPAAAAALSAGEHWREAAVIYRDKLSRPQEAAKCLEQGGLWSEAIALYDELKQFEKAGDLHTRLGQLEAAAASYRQEVERLVTARDRLSAARVLEFKLGAVDETIALLDEGWEQTPRQGDCLQLLFSVLARNGRHEQTLRRVAALCHSPLATLDSVSVTETLAQQGVTYPDEQVRSRSADATRVVAARVLGDANQVEAKRLIAALARLAPHDRLLRRDGNRYLQRRTFAPSKAAVRAPTHKIERIHRYRLTNECDFRAATWIDDVVYAAGVRGDEIELWRCLWNAESGYVTSRSALNWVVPPATRNSPILLTAHHEGDPRLLVHQVGSNPLPSHEHGFSQGGVFRTEVACGAVAGISRSTLAAIRTTGGFTWLANHDGGDLHVAAYSSTNALVFDRSVLVYEHDLIAASQSHSPLPQLAVRQGITYLAFAQQLFVFDRNEQQKHCTLPSVAVGIAAAPHNTRRRLAIAMEEGLLLQWDGVISTTQGVQLASGLLRPVIGFTSGGYLVAADEQQLQVYRTANGKAEFHAQLDTPNSHPVAMLAITKPNEFSLIDRDGVITTYSV